MKWVLIVLIFSGSNAGTLLTTHRFETERACWDSSHWIKDSNTFFGDTIKTTCILDSSKPEAQ